MAAALTGRADTALAVTVGRDRTARVWDLTADQPEESHTGSVCAVASAEFGGRPLALTAGLDGTAVLWDLRTRERAGRQPMEAHAGAAPAAALGTVAGRLLAATGGVDTLVRLWDPLAGTPVGPPLRGTPTPFVASGSAPSTACPWW